MQTDVHQFLRPRVFIDTCMSLADIVIIGKVAIDRFINLTITLNMNRFNHKHMSCVLLLATKSW